MKITSFKKWRTEDGTEHSTLEMAEHWVRSRELIDALVHDDRPESEVQNMLNTLSSHPRLVREWLDACDAMEKAAIR